MESHVITNDQQATHWYKAAPVEAFSANGGACVQYKGIQIAVFHFTATNEWYASQNMCPHKKQMVLSRGLIGDMCGEPKVACPLHKRSFSLVSGQNLNGEEYAIQVYPVKVEDGYVYIGVETTDEHDFIDER
jgi:nitrite reductase (NADH) small subunit